MNKPPVTCFILASSSPRRSELLSLLGIPFKVQLPHGEEPPVHGENATDYALFTAQAKANSISHEHPEALILGADTIVTLDDHVLGKPTDSTDAKRMLELLSNRTHRVITGLCLQQGEEVFTQAVSTDVTMKPLSPEEIEAYIAGGEPMDKAGAYAIQGGAAGMVMEIQGSYTNVVGLPLAELEQLLWNHFGLRRGVQGGSP